MIDLITVVFSKELDYLRTQAESVSLYVPHVNNIYVIVNDFDTVADDIDAGWWQQHSDKVKVIPYSTWDYTSRVTGWENQQLCKLLAAGDAASTWSMALDAKTWFIQTLDYEKLFDQDRRPRVGVLDTVPVFESSKQFVEQYFSVDLPQVLGPAGVPFMFHTDTVRSMINSFGDFINFFQINVKHPHCVTEFYLYSAYVLSRYGTYDVLYNKTPYYGCRNIADFDVPNFNNHMLRIKFDDRLLTASIHRTAYPLLTPEQLEIWAGFLYSKHINTISTWRHKWHSTLILP